MELKDAKSAVGIVLTKEYLVCVLNNNINNNNNNKLLLLLLNKKKHLRCLGNVFIHCYALHHRFDIRILHLPDAYQK